MIRSVLDTLVANLQRICSQTVLLRHDQSIVWLDWSSDVDANFAFSFLWSNSEG
jgi:hypothetical protein